MKQALIAVMFAVSASGGGHSALGGHTTHGMVQAAAEFIGKTAEAQHTASHDQLHDHAAQISHGDRDRAPGHQHAIPSCAFAHAHCCAAAILTSSQAILTVATMQPRQGRGCAMPYGQYPHPPLRPPRSAA